MNNQIVFAAFDDRKGPVPVIFNCEKSIANKVAIKSIVSTLSAREGQKKVEGEAIIPFPDEGLLGFIYYVSLDQKTTTGDFRVISLTFLAPSASANNLYSNAAILSNQAREIGEEINSSFIYGEPLAGGLEQKIFSWGISEETEVDIREVAIEEKPITLLDLYSFFPPVTGFRKYEDPLSYSLLAFLMEIPVVLSGPDPKHLFDFANIFQKIYQVKELRIELTIPVISKFAAQKIQKIPRADVVLLTDDQHKKSFFSRDPLVILTTYQEYKTPYHKFEEKYLKRVGEWLKKSRDITHDEELSLRTIKIEVDGIDDRLNQLIFLADGKRSMSTKEVQDFIDKSTRLHIDKELLDFLIDISLVSHKIPAKKLNILLSPSKPYEDLEFRSKDTIGMVNV
ncbi:MAG: hypothetical protein HeimC3_28640 [Candidatus Heimdallarchaeota archaeon LC_3]|nr:MAG: hypothetical protein HeimC3_28640 [Candidatus Heimdallarchaeota archaeon LC_3]